MTTTFATRSAWYDRWTKPDLASLVEALKMHHRRQFSNFIEKLDALERTEQSIIWFGPSWRWTIAYTMPPVAVHGGSNGRSARSSKANTPPKEPEIVCYLVPSVENPLVCVPLCDTEVAEVCAAKGQFGRYIKDGVATAKCAVTTRWATWAPATENETKQILDLIRRKYDNLCRQQGGNPQDN